MTLKYLKKKKVKTKNDRYLKKLAESVLKTMYNKAIISM